MKRQPETRAEGCERRPGPSGCANARRGPAWPGPGLHRLSGRPPSLHPRHQEYEDRTAQVPSCLAPARANTDQPPLAPPVLAIPASLAAGGAGRRGAKAHDAQPIALRRLRGPTQWERGTSSPLLPIPSFLLSCSSSSLSSPLCGQGQPKTPRGGISAVCTHTRTRS